MKFTTRVCLIVMLILLFVPILTAGAASVTFNEAAGFLTPARISTGVDGRVYVVDEGADALWRIDPSSSSYEKYFPVGQLMDAAPDGIGKIWWTDGAYTFGSFDLQASETSLKYWEMPGDGQGNPPNLGPVVVVDGKIWMATWFSSLFSLYRFTPGANGGELCHYPITGGSYATDLVVTGGRLWWLNYNLDKLFSFTPGSTSGTLVSYSIGRNINLGAGMVADQGSLWWAENEADRDLYRFVPDTPSLTTFDLPSGAYPVQVARLGGRTWYTDAGGWFGSLDPGKVSGVTAPLEASQPETITAVCQTLGAPASQDGTPFTGPLTWSQGTSTVTQPQTGVEIYSLPPGASPLGIAAAGSSLWVGDDGRNKLLSLHVGFGYSLYLPLVRK